MEDILLECVPNNDGSNAKNLAIKSWEYHTVLYPNIAIPLITILQNLKI